MRARYKASPSAYAWASIVSILAVQGRFESAANEILKLEPASFDYVNRLFGLSEGYLKTSLDINDSRYPNLSLSEYHESLATSSAAFLGAVRSAILASTSTQQ